MNKTFIIISPHFSSFVKEDFDLWFHDRLVSVLPSFTPEMLEFTITNLNCANYHVVVSGIVKVSSAMPVQRQQEIAEVLLAYLRKYVSSINTPVCRVGINTDAEWIETNLGSFAQYTTYYELKVFNLSPEAVVGALSPQQKAELITDPDSGALQNATFIRAVLTSLTLSGNIEQLAEFFQSFAEISKQKNITFITNAAVRDIILSTTLTALEPHLVNFEPEDYQLWFQDYLFPLLPSLRLGSLRVIPSNISCASYEAIHTGLLASLQFLPLDLSVDVRSSVESLKQTFPRCSVQDSFTCKKTPVDESHICAAVNGSQLQQTLATDASSTALCSFTITEHACSLATHLTQTNVITLLKCSLDSQRTYPVEVWKLFFQKASDLDQALDTFASMTPNNSSPVSPNALEALGEVKIATFSQEQLKNEDFIANWFQQKIRPFLASPSTNFLFCLSSLNFSCQTYQIVVEAFSNQREQMDSGTQQTVFTHFIKSFLSRNDSSDPGCIASVNGSRDWLQTNLGNFSGFATVQELQALNPLLSS
ncbi:uncharacterized protein LOC119429705, partial [Nematolebias whitei]|uniref:uncharacterized protein LOC119429705 n=1 Tax=Nematolebias whitei TaxID=451745 RepID=UPI001898FA58